MKIDNDLSVKNYLAEYLQTFKRCKDRTKIFIVILSFLCRSMFLSVPVIITYLQLFP